MSQIMACPKAIEGLSKALMNGISQLRLPNSGGTSPVGRLEGLRQRFREKNISNQAIDLISSLWRDKTNANYNSVWRAWSRCLARGIYPFATDISSVLDFLADKYTAGLEVSLPELLLISLLFCLAASRRFQMGQHSLVSRLLSTHVQRHQDLSMKY